MLQLYSISMLYYLNKKIVTLCVTILAGVVGFEPTTNGFGDHYSTVEPYP
ncbi:hypothetical protein CNEO3_100091 [Clostridium neonatale]|nr:hypothetical protein CNEO3_100091 [Clostridium neonatale]CAI3607888.1 hypothetical protein CNEO3_10150 [Clostridium neonatale]CAI3637033.1 hypothetical protein CNEO3_40092 [Clostridium neonatale]CAI3698661.1 hypothetical protein CNEO3_70091 [Clostridium neonatale]CAI3718727.1 hypothetical protein CNEO3_90090 [Clostridium neonatale]